MPYKDPIKQKEAQHRSYLKNIEKNKEKNKTYRQKVREYVQEQKSSSPCMDCGIKYPYYVMEYDHLGDKINSVSHISSRGTLNQVIEEINKCDLVCSNCHKIRTWTRMQK
jgi:uncharacterized protein (UPF0335 family)